MHPKNKTRFKSLDRLARDPRVVEIWDEGKDGIWVQLARGYNNEGCCTVHSWSVRGVYQDMKIVEEGPTY